MTNTAPLTREMIAEMIAADALPCAHCNGQGFATPPALGNSHWNVVCDDCGASGPHAHDDVMAVRRWNDRTITTKAARIAELEAEVGRLKEIVEMLSRFDGRNSIVHLRELARAALTDPAK